MKSAPFRCSAGLRRALPLLAGLWLAVAAAAGPAQDPPGASGWFVMMRHGECLPPAAFGTFLAETPRATPDTAALARFTTPQAFADQLRAAGYAVTVTAPPPAEGRAVVVEYRAPDARPQLPAPTLIFVRRAMCVGERPR